MKKMMAALAMVLILAASVELAGCAKTMWPGRSQPARKAEKTGEPTTLPDAPDDEEVPPAELDPPSGEEGTE